MGYNAARALNERIIGKGRMRPSMNNCRDIDE